MSLNPRVCKKSYKVHIPMMGEACEFWLITVTDEQSITNPDKDHAYLTDDGKLFVFNGDSLVRVNCDICFTQEEREKLEGIEEGANKYVLPVASSTELGGVLLGYTQNGRNYPITKDTKGNIYVNVPWEEYQLPKATDNALGGIKTGYKQNGKFYPIKTDTDGNAYVQVPWEDTNTVYEVVSKTSNGLMPMLPSDENASKRFLNGDGEWVAGTDNSINGVTQTGSTFSGETSDCGVEITKVVGKTEQQTTNGYQLFDASKIATKSQGGATVTNNNDGSFTISGSGNLTEFFSNQYIYSNEQFKKFIKKGQLKLNVGSSNPKFSVTFYDDSISPSKVYVDLEDGRNSGTITDEILNNSNIKMRVRFYGTSGTTIETGTIKPMFYQEGDGTWEPFTGGKPAPNPDYPMEIENVEISGITSHGRNLLPYPYYCGGIGIKKTQSGIDFEILPDKSFKLSGTATSDCYINLAGIEYGDENFGFQNYVGLVGNTNKYITMSYNPTNKITSINVAPNRAIDTIVYPMISKGKQVPEWEEPTGYNTTSTNLTLVQDDVYENKQITRVRKQATFDGSSDENWINGSVNDQSLIRFSIIIEGMKLNPSGKCNRFEWVITPTSQSTKEVIGGNPGESGLHVIIKRSRLETEDISGFKKWLQTHQLEIEYELATPTTEEFKVPTIPSYYPYTEVSTDSEVEPEITFRPLPYTTCLVGEATEEESGYMPKLSGNASQFLNGQGQWIIPETGSDINPDDYVKKSGDTMTGDLNMEAGINFGSQKGMSKDQGNRLIIGDTEHHTIIQSSSKVGVYNGKSGAESIVDTGDIVDNLSSTETKKPLSANQGKVLNDKIINSTNRFGGVTQFAYVSKVLQIPSAESVVQAYTLAELKELLQITDDVPNFSNRITATVINGAKNTNGGNIIACNYEEINQLMIIKTESADVGAMRCNFLIAYSGSIVG